MLEKAATMKRFEYSPKGKYLKRQTDTRKKQYQTFSDTSEFDKIIKQQKPTLENYSKSNLIYNANHSFYKYYGDSSFKSKVFFSGRIF